MSKQDPEEMDKQEEKVMSDELPEEVEEMLLIVQRDVLSSIREFEAGHGRALKDVDARLRAFTLAVRLEDIVASLRAEVERLKAENEKLREALGGLVASIDSAGLLNLSNGVQLGPTAWYVRASDRLDAARSVLKREEK